MRTRITKRLIGALVLVATVLVLALAIITLTLVKTGNRQITYMPSKSLRVQVYEETKGMDLEQIIDYSITLTASHLQFSRHNDINNHKANCVGYAQLCASICNHALDANGIKGKAKPVVGYVESIGINLCDVLKVIAPNTSYKNFVKDHDFVELVTNSKTYYFDPSIYDILGKKCLSIKTRQ